MKRKPGDAVKGLRLPALDGSTFDLDSMRGRPFMLSFLRFAACPFCNLRIHELVSNYAQLPEEFVIIAVFDSALDNLQRHADRHHSPFPILADEGNVYHKAYGVEHSIYGVLKGMLVRMPTLIYGMFGKGYLPLRINGSLTTMPADFLVDR
ncbi:MAG: peroxiredoxin family protein, partial [Gammaproteobacteria bacterium]